MAEDHDSLRAEEGLPRAKGSQNVPAGLPEPGNLLGKRGQSVGTRHRRGGAPGRVQGDGRIHAARRAVR